MSTHSSSSIINYRERLERVKFYLHQGDYQVVLRECGTLLEAALKQSYQTLLDLTPDPVKLERVRQSERQLCRPNQSFLDLGLGRLIRLTKEAKVFERLNQKDNQDYSGAFHFNFNHIINVSARNDATHRALIPSESVASLAHASLMAFLEAAHLLELPPELQKQRQEHFSSQLIRHWGKGFITPEEAQAQADLAAELELDPAVVTTLQAEVKTTLKGAIEAYQANLPSEFEAPPSRAYLTEKHNLPSVLATQVQNELKGYLKTTFPMSSERFEGLIDRFLEAPGQVFRGPYISVKLPFESGQYPLSEYFPELNSRFQPYLHQEQAFERLGSQQPQPTLVATGTGSGKTECFLYPLLHHCYEQRAQSGIKALIIYPMNALATDQARRLAQLIHTTPALKGQVNAGLYVGDRSGNETASMTAESIITQREALRDAPPDILLTNYKMLDLLLTRPEDQPLWRHNQAKTLQFLVVDEIHTFDGAQGTDLACLLRRLKSRLGTPAGHLCPVGTSATLGQENRHAILEYASKIFGEPFDRKSLIQEQRQSYGDFLADADILPDGKIYPEWAKVLDPNGYHNYTSYIQAQYKLWFGNALPEDSPEQNWRVHLGQALKTLRFFQNFVRHLRGKNLTRQDLLTALGKNHPAIAEADSEFGLALLDSLMALISSARSIPPGFEHDDNPPLMPFLQVRAQIWVRELRRMVSTVHPRSPELLFSDDQIQTEFAQLPLIHCRDCHKVAWGVRKHPYKAQYSQGLKEFYNRYRKGQSDLWLLYPDSVLEDNAQSIEQWLCPHCLAYGHSPDDIDHIGQNCNPSDAFRIKALPIFTPGKNTQRDQGADCQICSGQGSLNIIGHRASTLTSVMISQVLGSNYSDDKKIIAFSDSVQDASYRAGFFTARTYSFTLRSALQKYLDTLTGPTALSELGQGFSDYWRETYGDKAFLAQFFPADLTWLKEYEEFTQSGGSLDNPDTQEELVQTTTSRVGFEVYRELTFRSRTGRTLEKSNLAMVSVPLKALDPVVESLLLRLPEEYPQLAKTLNATTLRHTLALLLRQFKLAGTVYHPALNFIFENHMAYAIYVNARHIPSPKWLPRRQGYSGPRPLTWKNSSLESLTLQNRKSWYQWLLEKQLFVGEAIFEVRDRDALMRLIIDTLTRFQVLKSFDKGQHPGWALNPEQLILHTSLSDLRCNECAHQITIPTSELSLWQSQACGRRPCEQGLYQAFESEAQYYANFYRHAIPQRIYAAEHTGLLSRPVREAVEQEFMAPKSVRQEYPWYTNLLSSTPTLEMGIDIGDLSTVLLCSVPPTQSSYIQRIGRSGRSDGNSLNVTVAAGRPHDLYYFREPLEMIQGEVQTPGVFLGAAAVLERQLTAYCFDRWVATGLPPGAIDKKFKTVLNTLRQDTPAPLRFPYNFFDFITAHQSEIFEGFMNLFGDEITPEQRQELDTHLWDFLQGDQEGSLSYKILERLNHLAQECKNFQIDIDLLYKRIKKAEERPELLDASAQEELDRMRQEREGLRTLLKMLREKQLFNLLTDEGLLPNYAFPEEGITLRSVIYRKLKPKESEGQKKHYETFEFEYVRPAASALMELAPNNHFYAGGKKVRVNQVELRFGGKKDAAFELWRFCDQCEHMTREIDGQNTPQNECPKCGSTGWDDVGQVKKLVRMKQVFANTNIQDSLHLDRSEERSTIFFDKALMVEFEPHDVSRAYHLNNEIFAFGFEYIRKVRLRDINFGESNPEFQTRGQVNHSAHSKGFVLCNSCGMVQDPGILKDKTTKTIHAITCRNRRENTRPEDIFESSFLYREFQSEALRIFLPDDPRFAKETCRQSFMAALHLGLKEYFSGNIDHLSATIQVEPIPGQEDGKHFLVLYDQVPGGTGYLKQLTKENEGEPVLLEVLTRAFEILRSCSCQQEPEKDGCYHCIFTYRQINLIENLSRSTALELLATLLKHKADFEPTESISEIRPKGLQESELERRFLEAIRRLSLKSTPGLELKLTPDVVKGKLGHILQVNEYRYAIEPQAKLGPEQGVSAPSRADFLIRSMRESDGFLPIAIYTDGFAYHSDRLDKDTAQRMALHHSGKYRSWSLSWDDVNQHILEVPAVNYAWNPLPNPLAKPSILKMLTMAKKAPTEALLKRVSGLASLSPLEQLLHFLAHPEAHDWQNLINMCLLAQVKELKISSKDSQNLHRHFKESLLNISESLYELSQNAPVKDTYYFPHWDGSNALDNPEPMLQHHCRFPQKNLMSQSPGQIQVFLIDESQEGDPHYKVAWNGFLQMMNLLQFSPNTWFLSRKGVESELYHPIFKSLQAQPEESSSNPEWLALEDELLEEGHLPLWRALAEAGCQIPTLGYEPTAQNGAVLGLIEYAFKAPKWGLVLPEDYTEMQSNQRLEAIQSLGWELVVLEDEWVQSPELLIQKYATEMGVQVS